MKTNLHDIVKKMTLRQKIMQTFQGLASFYDGKAERATGPLWGLNLSEEQLYATGSVLNADGADDTVKVIDAYSAKNQTGVPLAFMMDVIHGYKTLYPINLAIAAAFDENLAKECAAMAAKEAAVAGVNATFAPMVDVSRDARWGRTMESAGDDTYLNSVMAKAAVEGFQGDFGKYNIAACVKHFCAYGAAEAGKDYNLAEVSYRTLYEYYLPPFQAAIDAGVALVMAAFNTVDGVPMSVNKRLINGTLRKQMGFDGVVISDWGGIRETIGHGVSLNDRDAAEKAITAGLDVDMMTCVYFENLENAVLEGKIDEKLIDDAVLRVLELKEKLGLFENKYRSASEEECKKYFLCPEHREIARRAAEKSAVLLKNDGILPFDGKKINKVAVIGRLGVTGELLGGWRCKGDNGDTVTVEQGVKNLLGEDKVVSAYGCGTSLYDSDDSAVAEAVEIAKNADCVILCLGENQEQSGEATSCAHLDLIDVQYKLFDAVTAVNDNVAVLLFTGRPLAIAKLSEKARAILNMWFPGTEGGNAAARLLFGEVSPSGKVPMSFPRCEGQCPVYYNHLNTGRARPDENIFENCTSSYIDCFNRPLYPFGYGLSYSRFEYFGFNLSANVMRRGEKITFSLTVKNSGDRYAEEVVQFYLRDDVASVARPVRELKGFKRVGLNAGKQKTVCFDITQDMLAFYDTELNKIVENGTFSVFAGGSSLADKRAEFELID